MDWGCRSVLNDWGCGPSAECPRCPPKKIYTSHKEAPSLCIEFSFANIRGASSWLWNTLENPSLSETSTSRSFTAVFLYHLQLIFANSHVWSHVACLALLKIMSTCLVWAFFFLWAFLFELCPWGLDCQQNVTIKSIAWYCAAGYRVRYFEICWRDLSCFCSFLYNYCSLPGMKDKMDAYINLESSLPLGKAFRSEWKFLHLLFVLGLLCICGFAVWSIVSDWLRQRDSYFYETFLC